MLTARLACTPIVDCVAMTCTDSLDSVCVSCVPGTRLASTSRFNDTCVGMCRFVKERGT